MKTGLTLIIILIAASFTTQTNDEDIIVLNESNFDEILKSHQYLLVKFYSPNCTHSKNLEPDFLSAAQILKNQPEEVRFGQVDGTLHKNLLKRFNIRGFPTIKFFVNGELAEYKGGRSSEGIVKFINGKVKQVFPQIKVSHLDYLKKEHRFLIIYSGEKNLENRFFKAFDVIVNTFKPADNIKFANMLKETAKEHFNVEENTIIFLNNRDDELYTLSTEYDEEKLKEFLTVYQRSTVMRFNYLTSQFMMQKNTSITFFRDRSSQTNEEYEKIIKSAARKTKGRIQFVESDLKDKLELRFATYLDISEKDLPTIWITDTRTGFLKYRFSGEITEENILKFIDDWEKDKLEPLFKSEEIPEKQEEDLYVLVGKSFNTVVLDESKDVIVMFYAPWSKISQKFFPDYEQVAKAYKHNENLIFAKMDSTKNECQQVTVREYPTVRLFVSGQKSQPIRYEGAWNVEELTAFLETHITKKKSETNIEL